MLKKDQTESGSVGSTNDEMVCDGSMVERRINPFLLFFTRKQRGTKERLLINQVVGRSRGDEDGPIRQWSAVDVAIFNPTHEPTHIRSPITRPNPYG